MAGEVAPAQAAHCSSEAPPKHASTRKKRKGKARPSDPDENLLEEATAQAVLERKECTIVGFGPGDCSVCGDSDASQHTECKFEDSLIYAGRDKEKIEKAVQDTLCWPDKNQLAEKDEFETKQKELEDLMESGASPPVPTSKTTIEDISIMLEAMQQQMATKADCAAICRHYAPDAT